MDLVRPRRTKAAAQFTWLSLWSLLDDFDFRLAFGGCGQFVSASFSATASFRSGERTERALDRMCVCGRAHSAPEAKNGQMYESMQNGKSDG